jgi:photosystem II stability/assembly factor-like uncharacterized protein
MLQRVIVLRAVLALSFVLFAFNPAIPAQADNNVWEEIGPSGGPIYAIAIKSGAPNTIYVGTQGSGVFKTTNGGQNWNQINTGLPGFNSNSAAWHINSIVIDPETPSTVYIGTSGGIYKSTNDGQNWTSANEGLTNLSVSFHSLVIDPLQPEILYAGIYGGVYASSNSGDSWAAVINGLTSHDISSLAINPLFPSILYAGTISGGVFKTTNSGGQWTAVNTGDMCACHVYVLAIDPKTPSTVYAGTIGKGLYKTTTGGLDWTLITGPSAYITGLAIIPENPSTLYYGHAFNGVFKSSNGGDSWEPFNVDLSNSLVDTLALDPSSPHVLYAGTENNVFAATLGTNFNQFIFIPGVFK